MEYTLKDIDKILSFKTWDDKQKIDALLQMDCTMYCNLGSDSTLSEKKEVKRKSKDIYRAIKKVDKAMGDLFLSDVDQ